MYVGCGVKVGCGVFNSMVGGWSPTTGGSSVGRVENIPGGAVGEDAGSSAGPPQAIIASRAIALAASPTISLVSLRPLFLFLTFPFLRVGNNLFCRTRPPTLQHYRADSTYLPFVESKIYSLKLVGLLSSKKRTCVIRHPSQEISHVSLVFPHTVSDS